MRRPRWHDVVIVVTLAAFVLVGVWALWWDDVRIYLHFKPEKPGSGSAVEKPQDQASSSPRT